MLFPFPMHSRSHSHYEPYGYSHSHGIPIGFPTPLLQSIHVFKNSDYSVISCIILDAYFLLTAFSIFYDCVHVSNLLPRSNKHNSVTFWDYVIPT